MSFRQPKSQSHKEREAWAVWIDRVRSVLKSIGLPPGMYLSREHWEDFLENGSLDWHPEDSTGFSFDQLSPASAEALRRFLEAEYGDDETPPPLLRWLRARHEAGRSR